MADIQNPRRGPEAGPVATPTPSTSAADERREQERREQERREQERREQGRREQGQEASREVRQGTQGRPMQYGEEHHEQGRATPQELQQRTQELATQGKEIATEYYDQGRERVAAWQEQLEHQVREKPLQSLLMAAGIGLLIGLLKGR